MKQSGLRKVLAGERVKISFSKVVKKKKINKDVLRLRVDPTSNFEIRKFEKTIRACDLAVKGIILLCFFDGKTDKTCSNYNKNRANYKFLDLLDIWVA